MATNEKVNKLNKMNTTGISSDMKVDGPEIETLGYHSNAPSGIVGEIAAIAKPVTAVNSQTKWEDQPDYLDSQTSPPTLLENPWILVTPHISSRSTTAPSSPLVYSPGLEDISSRYIQEIPDSVEVPRYTTSYDKVIRKPLGRGQFKVADDVRKSNLETSDDSFRFVARSTLQIDNYARDHLLYQNVETQADGLYHCPWEAQNNCRHKPEKLKCNYDKFVDSHLKPYRCKLSACDNLHFSSTACLLRHEREAHAMHGGGKPFLCTYEGCERGTPGNGFPRHWNVRDHMKRVHGVVWWQQSPSPPPIGKCRKREKEPDSAEPSPPRRDSEVYARFNNTILHEALSFAQHYQESAKKLLEIAKKLQDPTKRSSMSLLRDASDCINTMAQTTQRINQPLVVEGWSDSIPLHKKMKESDILIAPARLSAESTPDERLRGGLPRWDSDKIARSPYYDEMKTKVASAR